MGCDTARQAIAADLMLLRECAVEPIRSVKGRSGPADTKLERGRSIRAWHC